MLGLFLLVHAQQWLLQWRAERLHTEVVALQLHPRTFADVRRMQREWGKFGRYEGKRTADHCIYEIVPTDWLADLEFVKTGRGMEPEPIVGASTDVAHVVAGDPPVGSFTVGGAIRRIVTGASAAAIKIALDISHPLLPLHWVAAEVETSDHGKFRHLR